MVEFSLAMREIRCPIPGQCYYYAFIHECNPSFSLECAVNRLEDSSIGGLVVELSQDTLDSPKFENCSCHCRHRVLVKHECTHFICSIVQVKLSRRKSSFRLVQSVEFSACQA